MRLLLERCAGYSEIIEEYQSRYSPRSSAIMADLTTRVQEDLITSGHGTCDLCAWASIKMKVAGDPFESMVL